MGLNTRPPNAPNQKPAVAGQTRAPERKANVAFDVITVAEGLVTYTRLDGSQVKLPFVNVFDLSGDEVARYLIYIDNAPLFAVG